MPMEIAAAVILVISAVVTGAVTVIKAVERSRIALLEAMYVANRKAEIIIEKTQEISHSTNSNLSQVTAALNAALGKIDGLNTLVASQADAKRIADDLAVRQGKAQPK